MSVSFRQMAPVHSCSSRSTRWAKTQVAATSRPSRFVCAFTSRATASLPHKRYLGIIGCLFVLSVCLSVCPLAYLENYTAELHQIFCTCWVCGRGSVLLWRRCDTLRTVLPVSCLTSMFSHSGLYSASSVLLTKLKLLHRFQPDFS